MTTISRPIDIARDGPRRARPRSFLRHLRAACSIAGVSAAAPAAAAPTLISINLCTDQLVMSLADPGQILGISRYSTDTARSWAAGRSSSFAILSGTAEEVLVARPDLVLGGRFTKRATRDLLRAQGVPIVELDAARSLDDARRQIVEVATLVGHPGRAAAEIGAIDAALSRARAAAAGRRMSVLPLQRRGWISGRDSLLTSLVEAVGLRNAGADLSRGLGRQVTLEAIIALKPDLLLVSGLDQAADDQGSALLQHPALAALYPPERRIVVPERLTLCSGPMLPEALDHLAREVRRIRAAARPPASFALRVGP